MCGISGIISSDNCNHTQDILKMISSLNHRGPDFNDSWIDRDNQVYLGHNRLSIIDLSIKANQPMHSKNNRYVIIYNGEIYNHLQLKDELILNNESVIFNSYSDTEIILECISFWGFEKAIKKFNGMFSLCVFDKKNKSIYLCIDRMGEKPLYYGIINGNFIFASELKAIKNLSFFKESVNKSALYQFLNYSYVPSPLTIYNNVFKIEPGQYLELKIANNDNSYSKNSYSTHKWFTFSDLVNESRDNQINDYNYAKSITENCLKKSIERQSISDVSLGVFLSGGIDSTLLSVLKSQISVNKIDTFTVSFDEVNYNEASYAKKISEYIGSNHTEILIKEKSVYEVIENLPSIYDEPFADSSQIPTTILCKNAKKNLSVCLTGDGGDEIFGGYNRYIWFNKIWKNIYMLPKPLKLILSKIILMIPVEYWNNLSLILSKIKFLNNSQIHFFGQKLHKLSYNLTNIKNKKDLYYTFLRNFYNLDDFDTVLYESNFDFKNSFLASEYFEEVMMHNDSVNYLPNDILTKVDRASMHSSLETRAPFLDINVMKTAWRLPKYMKVNNNKGKLILRDILNDYLPRNLFERPKQGFSIPIKDMLNGSLREWTNDLINSKVINDEIFFKKKYVTKLIREHSIGKKNWDNSLWAILIFIQWYNANY